MSTGPTERTQLAASSRLSLSPTPVDARYGMSRRESPNQTSCAETTRADIGQGHPAHVSTPLSSRPPPQHPNVPQRNGAPSYRDNYGKAVVHLIRARLRAMGFRISDFADCPGFVESDLDDLIARGAQPGAAPPRVRFYPVHTR